MSFVRATIDNQRCARALQLANIAVCLRARAVDNYSDVS